MRLVVENKRIKMNIFHLMSIKEFKDFSLASQYCPISLEQEGFIHFSFAHQLAGVIERFYLKPQILILIKVKSEEVKKDLKIEGPLDPEEEFDGFPHLYAPLSFKAVAGHRELSINDDLSFDIPTEWLNEEA